MYICYRYWPSSWKYSLGWPCYHHHLCTYFSFVQQVISLRMLICSPCGALWDTYVWVPAFRGTVLAIILQYTPSAHIRWSGVGCTTSLLLALVHAFVAYHTTPSDMSIFWCIMHGCMPCRQWIVPHQQTAEAVAVLLAMQRWNDLLSHPTCNYSSWIIVLSDWLVHHMH